MLEYRAGGRSENLEGQLVMYSTLLNKSTGTTIFQTFFLSWYALYSVGTVFDFLSEISNSNEKFQKPQAVQFDMNHVFHFLEFSGRQDNLVF